MPVAVAVTCAVGTPISQTEMTETHFPLLAWTPPDKQWDSTTTPPEKLQQMGFSKDESYLLQSALIAKIQRNVTALANSNSASSAGAVRVLKLAAAEVLQQRCAKARRSREDENSSPRFMMMTKNGRHHLSPKDFVVSRFSEL